MANTLNIVLGDHSVVARKRVFKSGADGFGHYGKIEIDGERYQVSCNVIRIGSKPEEGETRAASGAMLGEPTADANADE